MSAFFLLLESTFKDQINPKRQTAGPREGGSPELDLVRVSMHADGKHWQPRAEPHSLVPGYHAGAGDSENATTQAWAGRPNWVFRAMRV